MNMMQRVYYASTGLIEKSSKVKGDIPYMDAILKVAPEMFFVLQLLVSYIPEDKLDEVYDVIKQINFKND